MSGLCLSYSPPPQLPPVRHTSKGGAYNKTSQNNKTLQFSSTTTSPIPSPSPADPLFLLLSLFLFCFFGGGDCVSVKNKHKKSAELDDFTPSQSYDYSNLSNGRPTKRLRRRTEYAVAEESVSDFATVAHGSAVLVTAQVKSHSNAKPNANANHLQESITNLHPHFTINDTPYSAENETTPNEVEWAKRKNGLEKELFMNPGSNA